MRPRVTSAFLSAILCLAPKEAAAGEDWLSDLQGWVDFRSAYTTADREWLDGGFSKTRYGSVDGEGVDAEIADASLVWTPRFGASWSGHFHLQSTPDQDIAASGVEAFVSYRALPKFGWRVSARGGRYFPLVSLEHDGPGWGVTRTITPSAINSWIGEEVAVTGLEARAARAFGDHRVDIKLGGFGLNDTAGALLAYRGWALHDVKTMMGGSFRLPDRDDRRAILPEQEERTRPFQELDGRIGINGSVTWRYADNLKVLLSAYDNRADSNALEDGQYGWRTRFINLGANYKISGSTEIIAQGLYGDTVMGPRSAENSLHLVDTEFYSAFGLLSHRLSDTHVISTRFDYFATNERGNVNLAKGESGWAATLSSLHRVVDRLDVGGEALYVDNNGGNDPTTSERVRDLQFQLMIRVGF